MGDKVSLQAQVSPYFQLREQFKCIEHIDKSETQLKLLPETRKSEQNVSQFEITSLALINHLMMPNICLKLHDHLLKLF